MALQQVLRDLAEQGLGLKVWDAHRPLAVQQRMWDAIQDPRYVSNLAVNAGRHTRGTAVDVTLVDQRGRQLLMLTDFDDFSAAAWENAPGIPAELVENALRLRQASRLSSLKHRVLAFRLASLAGLARGSVAMNRCTKARRFSSLRQTAIVAVLRCRSCLEARRWGACFI